MWTEPGWYVRLLPAGGRLPCQRLNDAEFATAIEDDELAEAVLDRMVEAGVPVIEALRRSAVSRSAVRRSGVPPNTTAYAPFFVHRAG